MMLFIHKYHCSSYVHVYTHTSQENKLLTKEKGDFRTVPHPRTWRLQAPPISADFTICTFVRKHWIPHNEHLFLLASSCPHWFYGRRTRWWWDPVHLGGCRGPADAEHLQVPFGTGRVLGAPRYSWECSDFVISLLRYWSHLARVIIWMMPFSLLIECSQVASCRAFPDPEPCWNAERGEI